jgi:hypothetical protein
MLKNKFSVEPKSSNTLKSEDHGMHIKMTDGTVKQISIVKLKRVLQA